MKSIWKKWSQISLVKQILIGLIIGVILAVAIPTVAKPFVILGSLFVGALKAIAPVFYMENQFPIWDTLYINVSSDLVVTAQWQQTFFFSLNNNQVTIMHLNIAYPYDDAIIPETLYDFPVTALDNYILSDSQVRNVFIPKTVLQISSLTFSGYMGLSSVTVDEDNPFYTSYEGALYSKDMTTLIAHPHRANGEYIIPFIEIANITSIREEKPM